MREKVHLGFNQPWAVFVEGRDSSASNDDREPNLFEDSFDLHQTYVRVGNRAEFPFL